MSRAHRGRPPRSGPRVMRSSATSSAAGFCSAWWTEPPPTRSGNGAVAAELRLHDPALLDRPWRLVVSKQDLAEARERWPEVQERCGGTGSSQSRCRRTTGPGSTPSRWRWPMPSPRPTGARNRSAPRPCAGCTASIRPPRDGRWWPRPTVSRIRGVAIERTAARTDFTNEESRDRFQRRLERMGIDAELRRLGARNGTSVRIGAQELEWGDPE